MRIEVNPYTCYKCRAIIYPIERKRLGYPLREATCGGDPIGWACDDCDLEPQTVPNGIKALSQEIYEQSTADSIRYFIKQMRA